MVECKNCKSEIHSKDKRKKFCNRSCSAQFNNRNRVVTDEHRDKIRIALLAHFQKMEQQLLVPRIHRLSAKVPKVSIRVILLLYFK